MKIAFVHDWLVTYRGGEKVLESLITLYPDAPIYTLFYDPTELPTSITSREIIFPKKLQHFQRFRRYLLPFFPVFIESLPLEEYDLVISTSSCVAKGVITRPDSHHLCYLHSPMRYIWDQRSFYNSKIRHFLGIGFIYNSICTFLRIWDSVSASRVDKFLVNSSFVEQRVRKYYGRSSTVVHPPIELNSFKPSEVPKKGGYFLVAGSFVPYKRFDLAIKACNQADRKLVIAGYGPEESRLRQLAGNQTHFEIKPDRKKWLELLQHADALLFPGVEDFGMVPIEAMASGTAVLAFQGGGALDYIIPGKTGAFFSEASSQCLAENIVKFNPTEYDQAELLKQAGKFSNHQFLDKIKHEISQLRGTH